MIKTHFIRGQGLRIWLAGLWLLGASVPLFGESKEFVVCSWNIENFGVTDRFIDNRPVNAAMKPDREIKGMITILQRINPDILGLMEIVQDSEDKYVHLIQSLLKEAGLHYPYLSTLRGEDTRIQNVLLSRYPIIQQEPLNQDTFAATQSSRNSTDEKIVQLRMSRGITNATIQITPGYQVQVMLLHLKSRRPYPEITSDDPNEPGDAFIRRNEAVIARNAMNRALQANPGLKLMVMGDFNDQPGSKAVKTLIGPKDAAVPTYDLWLRDWLGDWWTHFYIPEKSYQRIDYMVVSKALFQDYVAEKSFVFRPGSTDGPLYDTYGASDHRPLVATFRIMD